MEFKLNEDQQMIHDLAKDFAESVLQPLSLIHISEPTRL